MTADAGTVQETGSREAILDAAERLMTTVGYDKASISRICKESGLPVGSLYHHFGSKGALLAEVIKRVETRFFASFPPVDESAESPDQGLEAFWDAAIEAIVANYRYFLLDVDLLRLSHEDAELRPIIEAQTYSSRHLVAAALLPFAHIAGVADADALTHLLADSIVTYTRGAIMNAANDQEVLRRDMARFYPIVHDVVVAAGRDEAAQLLSSRRR